jgi:hypothetical protein
MFLCQHCTRPLTWCTPRFCPVCTYTTSALTLERLALALLVEMQPLLPAPDQCSWVLQQWQALMQEINQIVIDRPPESAPQAMQVRANADISHRRDSAIQRYKKAVSRDAPAAEFVLLFQTAFVERKRYLHRLMTPQTTREAFFDTLAFERDHRVFESCFFAIEDARQHTEDLQVLLRQAVEAMRQAVEAMRQAVEAMRQTLFEGLPWQTGACIAFPIPEVQGWATLALSGWIASQISFKHNPRLREVLRKELAIRGEYAQSSQSELYERLPANTYRAWREREWQTLAELRTRIAYLVEHDASDQSPQEFHTDELLQTAPQALDDPTYEAVARKLEEEDQYMARLIKEADLKPHEAMVVRAKMQSPPSEHPQGYFSDQEVADMLGYSLGTVKQALLQARPKMRRVINQ